ncbi:LysM peptidoglycan-binding domain-containing protein [Algoriphagus formosus]|uniref:lytic transglycosylase domain-containing protein n=1 Tax=Algoriphagus formosus TaxID=2007308 RepID=UPI003F6FBADD
MTDRNLKIFILIVFTFSLSISTAFPQENELVAPDLFDENLVQPNYHYEYIPDFTYDLIKERVDKMDSEMSFELNDRIFSFIQYFTVRNRDYTKMVLARKDLFFPLFEETLAEHEMPDDIKYLSIIESGLDPQIRSRVGAMGLWQFMPATGRMYGMDINWDIDERMDPEQSTEAAAKYLKSLYRMFGDWELALAAYNCGPGNVRKAIRRSGGKKKFWEIYNYLPRETRGYVPQFQAMMYILRHLDAHNLHLEEPTYSFATESIRFERAFTLDKLSELTNLCLSDLEKLNPAVKRRKIPESHKSMAIRVPVNQANYVKENFAWIADSLGNELRPLLASDKLIYRSEDEKLDEIERNTITYRVQSGDNLGKIAQNYRVSVSQIKEWNNLSSNLIRVGQRLTLHAPEGAAPSRTIAKVQTNSNGQKTYVVQPGDSLWIISRRFAGLTVDQLKRLNNLNSTQIKPGQRLIIG